MVKDIKTYTTVAKAFHWVIALAVFAMFISVMMMDADLSPEGRKALYTFHKSLGFLILIATVFRLAWRHRHPAPPLPVELMPSWQIIAANFAHASLYVLAFLVPLVGWAMVSAGPYGLKLFGVITIPNLPLPMTGEGVVDQTVVELLSKAHEVLGILLAVTIVFHISGAILHHFVYRDDVLLRMTPDSMRGFLLRLRR